MRYAGNFTIIDDQGDIVHQRDLSPDEMIAELLGTSRVQPIKDEPMLEMAHAVDAVLKGPMFEKRAKKAKKSRGGGRTKRRHD